jgi:hypothetical protein
MTAAAHPAPAEPASPAPVPPPAPESEPFALPPEPGPHPLAAKRTWRWLAPLLVVLNLPFLHLALRGEAEVTATLPFEDRFDRAGLGEHWWSGGGHWRLAEGALYSPGVKNNPLWLKARLPRDVVIEFTVRGESAAGDLKVELFGNGRDHSSGYVLIFGGWNNSTSIISRLDEHGRDRLERKDLKVERGRTYRWRIERTGGKLTWSIDGEKFLELDDPKPLAGRGHDRFGFSGWQSDAFFDDLVIRTP